MFVCDILRNLLAGKDGKTQTPSCQHVEELNQLLDELKRDNEKQTDEIKKLLAQKIQNDADMNFMKKEYNKVQKELEETTKKLQEMTAAFNKLNQEYALLRTLHFGSTSENTPAFLNKKPQESDNSNSTPQGNQPNGSDCVPESPVQEQAAQPEEATGKPEEQTANSDDKPESSAESSQPEGSEPTGKQEKTVPSHESEGEGKGEGEGKSGKGKGSRPNNIRKQLGMLPTIDPGKLSTDIEKTLNELYGTGWSIVNLEPRERLAHVPETYVHLVEYVPVIKLPDGRIVRPYSEHRELFPNPIPNSVWTSGVLADFIHKKFCLGLPFYRIEHDLETMEGIHIGRQSMCDMAIEAATGGFWPVYQSLLEQEAAGIYHGIDETYLQVLNDGRAPSTKSYLWGHVGSNDGHKIIAYVYEKTRAMEHLRKYFPEDIVAIIMSDCFVDYDAFAKERPETVVVIHCWMHVRRNFFYAFDMLQNVSGISDDMIRNSDEAKLLLKIGEIYKAEGKLKGLSLEEKAAGRIETVEPLVQKFFETLHAMDLESPTISFRLKQACEYALNAEESLKMFLYNPKMPIDNGETERAFKPVCIGRRAWLFADTEDGAKTLAVMYTLTQTAIANGANAYYYIKYLTERLPDGIHSILRKLTPEELRKLMPWSPEYRAYEEAEKQRVRDLAKILANADYNLFGVYATRENYESLDEMNNTNADEVENPSSCDNTIPLIESDPVQEPIIHGAELPYIQESIPLSVIPQIDGFPVPESVQLNRLESQNNPYIVSEKEPVCEYLSPASAQIHYGATGRGENYPGGTSPPDG